MARALLFSDGEREEEEEGEEEKDEDVEMEVEVRVPTQQKVVDAPTPPSTAPPINGGGKGMSWLEGHLGKYGKLDSLLDEILKGATQ